MHPAFSVILLTTLIGAGQGLFVAVYLVQCLAEAGAVPGLSPRQYASVGVVALALLSAGLLASFFHLGHPERAWRTAACWRTSWLSREVIVLPALMAAIGAWVLAQLGGGGQLALVLGAVALVTALALYVSTAMIYACIRFLAEWATPLTVINFLLLGLASGFTLATALAALAAPASLLPLLGGLALVLTLAAAVFRLAALVRNDRLAPRSTPQSAIGVRHARIVQRSQGATAGSFNTREFFHHAAPGLYRSMRWVFVVLAFVLPAVLLPLAVQAGSAPLLALVFAVQFLGLVAERWYFFAQANHPQNLYYQYVS